MISKKNKVGGLTLPDFKTYQKATITMRMWYQQNDMYKDNKDSPETHSHIWSIQF